MVLNLETEPVPAAMLTMRTQPVEPRFVAQPALVRAPTAIAEPVVVPPAVSVQAGKVHTLRDALDKTCTDNFSKDFQQIGALLDRRETVVRKVKEHSTAVQKFKENVKKHITEKNIAKSSAEKLANRLYFDVNNSDMKLDSQMQKLANDLAEMESQYQANMRKLDKTKETSDKNMKKNKNMIFKLTGILANTTYEISRIKEENKQYQKSITALNDSINHLNEIKKALSNGVRYDTTPHDTGLLSLEPASPRRLSVHSMHDMDFPETVVSFQPPELLNKFYGNTLQPTFTPNIAVISPSDSSESLSTFDDLADMPSTVNEVEQSYKTNRDSIQGNRNKLDVLHENSYSDSNSDSEDGSLSPVSCNGSRPSQKRDSMNIVDLDEMLRALAEG